jgi:histidyl-tRNA synthetase
MAKAPRPDRGVAVLYGDEPLDVLLSTARTLRSGGRSAGLVARRGQMRRQLDDLKAEGYTSFVLLDGSQPAGAVPAERPLN